MNGNIAWKQIGWNNSAKYWPARFTGFSWSYFHVLVAFCTGLRRLVVCGCWTGWIPVGFRQNSASFLGKAVGVRVVSGVTPAVEAAPTKEAAASDDDDELDLFGDETEDEKKASKAREASKAPAKKKGSGKSSVLLDIKPWDEETDMKKLKRLFVLFNRKDS